MRESSWTISNWSTFDPGVAIQPKNTTRLRFFHTLVYKAADFLAAALAWSLFFFFRASLEGQPVSVQLFRDANLWYGLALVPAGWLLVYSLFDQYRDIYRLSRTGTLARTFLLTLLGVTALFFTLLLDDKATDYTYYYIAFAALFAFQFLLTAASRTILLTLAHKRLQQGRIGFNTLVIGGNTSAVELYNNVSGKTQNPGYKFVGFIDSNGNSTNELRRFLPCLGKLDQLSAIVRKYQVEEVIIAVETSEHNKLKGILNTLFDFDRQIHICIIPDMYDILLGSVKMNQIFGEALIRIRQDLFPAWQKVAKRLMDIAFSLTVMLLLAPLYAYAALMVRLSSQGPIFFCQERIGRNGKPFQIYKFRSMYLNAEQDGPRLSKDGDERCTPWGALMRKWRLDELPQFWNVLKGDMSVVGPRPERQFYIDQIVRQAPHYRHLLKVRPGITSWGQVKYGYASNVEQMIQRLKFDILYIENMSLSLDFKIMFYTGWVILQGKGK